MKRPIKTTSSVSQQPLHTQWHGKGRELEKKRIGNYEYKSIIFLSVRLLRIFFDQRSNRIASLMRFTNSPLKSKSPPMWFHPPL